MNTITRPDDTIESLNLIIASITGERMVKQSQGVAFVLNANFAVPLLGRKVRVTLYLDAYAFQCRAKAEVLDRETPEWHTVATREAELLAEWMKDFSRYSPHEAEMRDAFAAFAHEMVREVFDLLV